jgi:hypothetical protein
MAEFIKSTVALPAYSSCTALGTDMIRGGFELGAYARATKTRTHIIMYNAGIDIIR